MTSTHTPVLSLLRGDGSVAYDVRGSGPLLVCVPGMGDLRASYRFLAPALADAGYRVVTMDLRGHGESDTSFDDYGDRATAGDIAALLEELGEPAVLVGSSMSAGSAVLVAAEHPELVRGLVLVGPFVRTPPTTMVMKAMFRVLMATPWAAASWRSYLPTLYAGRRPADFEDYRAALVAAIRRPGHARAFSLTTRTSHDEPAAALPRVTASALVVMGELDPDFPDPAVEASWVGEQLSAEVLMVPEAGHYPHSQRPELVAPAVVRFLAGLPHA